MLEDLGESISTRSRTAPQHGVSHLFEKTCANGAGELGESVYGLKADFRWPAVGEGISWVAVAMLHLASQTLRRNCAAKLNLVERCCRS